MDGLKLFAPYLPTPTIYIFVCKSRTAPTHKPNYQFNYHGTSPRNHVLSSFSFPGLQEDADGKREPGNEAGAENLGVFSERLYYEESQ